MGNLSEREERVLNRLRQEYGETGINAADWMQEHYAKQHEEFDHIRMIDFNHQWGPGVGPNMLNALKRAIEAEDIPLAMSLFRFCETSDRKHRELYPHLNVKPRLPRKGNIPLLSVSILVILLSVASMFFSVVANTHEEIFNKFEFFVFGAVGVVAGYWGASRFIPVRKQ